MKSNCWLPDLSPTPPFTPHPLPPALKAIPAGCARLPFQTGIHTQGFSPTPSCLHVPSNLSSFPTAELCDSEDVSYGFGLRNPLWQRAEIWCPGTGQILGTDYSGSSSSGSAGWSDNATGVRDLQVTLLYPKTFITPRSTGISWALDYLFPAALTISVKGHIAGDEYKSI